MASLYQRTFVIAPGGQESPAVTGNYIRVKKSAVPVWIETDSGDRFDLAEGDEAHLERFTRLRISHDSGVDQSISLYVGDGASVGSARLAGEVAIPGGVNVNNPIVPVMSVVQTVRTVTAVSGSIAPVRESRKFLIIQNRSQVGTIWIKFLANLVGGDGIRVGPGEKLEFVGGVVPVSLVYAIGDMAANPDIFVVEGH